MATQNGTNGRTGNTGNRSQVKTPSAPQVPTVLTFTLPEFDEWESDGYNWTVIPVDDAPADVIFVALHAEDVMLSSKGRTVLQANANFAKLDSRHTLSMTLMRGASNADRANPSLENPNSTNR
jgi:hypothetical protein